ncbi:unnamed protein product [Aphanomyces euteiches]|nr:hypothetical protein AeRB84_001335 [Aphanomyces euteiches]
MTWCKDQAKRQHCTLFLSTLLEPFYLRRRRRNYTMSFNAGAKTSLLQYPANNRICGDSTRRRMMVRSGLKPVAGKFPTESSRSLPTSLQYQRTQSPPRSLQSQRPQTMPPIGSDSFAAATAAAAAQYPPKAASFGPPARPSARQLPPQSPVNQPHGEMTISRSKPTAQQPVTKYNTAPAASTSVQRHRSTPDLHDSRVYQNNHNHNHSSTSSSSSSASSTRSAPGFVPLNSYPAKEGKPQAAYVMEDFDDIHDGGYSPSSHSIMEWHDSISDSIASVDGNSIRERAKLIRTLSKNLAVAHQPEEPLPIPITRTHNDMIPLLATRLSTPDDEYGSDEEEF